MTWQSTCYGWWTSRRHACQVVGGSSKETGGKVRAARGSGGLHARTHTRWCLGLQHGHSSPQTLGLRPRKANPCLPRGAQRRGGWGWGRGGGSSNRIRQQGVEHPTSPGRAALDGPVASAHAPPQQWLCGHAWPRTARRAGGALQLACWPGVIGVMCWCWCWCCCGAPVPRGTRRHRASTFGTLACGCGPLA